MTVRRTMSGHKPRVDLAPELALALVQSSADGILVVDRGAIVYANRQAERMFGYGEGALTGLSVEDLVPESVRVDHSRRRRDFEERALARPMGMGLDLIACRADGTTFFADISLTPIELGSIGKGPGTDQVDPEGKEPTADPAHPEGYSGLSGGRVVVASVRDVSDRVEAESRMYEVLSSLDAAEDALYVFDDTTLAVSFVNQGAVRQLGYDTNELKAMTPLHFCPEFDRESLTRMLEPLKGAEVPNCAYRTIHRTRSGRDLAVQVVAQWIPMRSGGGHFVALARDISEHAAVESNLIRAREILDKLGEGVVIHREDTLTIEYVNQGYCEMMGLEPADLVGLTPEHIPGLDAAAFREKVASLADGSRPWATYEREMTDGSGRTRMCEVHLQALRPGPDLPRSIVALVRDVTDRRESESRARLAERELDLMTDRERIARDLHDSVIQRLFATGMSLQVASRRIG
ncbi:MAG TPA: PAS domain S-box protein, partial [Acidimicrobiales bacterium]|nr:PAS domain S-box protein [Acidimicrobiales bacterium]